MSSVDAGQLYVLFEGETQWRYVGVVTGLEIAGDTKYDVSVGLAAFDPQGYGRMYVSVMSPERSISLEVLYVVPEYMDFSTAVQRFVSLYNSWIRARGGIGATLITTQGVTTPPRVAVGLGGGICLTADCYPTTMSFELRQAERVIRVSMRAHIVGLGVGACPSV